MFLKKKETWNDLIGLSWPSLQTWICMSVEQEAKLSSHFQSTSAHRQQYMSHPFQPRNYLTKTVSQPELKWWNKINIRYPPPRMSPPDTDCTLIGWGADSGYRGCTVSVQTDRMQYRNQSILYSLGYLLGNDLLDWSIGSHWSCRKILHSLLGTWPSWKGKQGVCLKAISILFWVGGW